VLRPKKSPKSEEIGSAGYSKSVYDTSYPFRIKRSDNEPNYYRHCWAHRRSCSQLNAPQSHRDFDFAGPSGFSAGGKTMRFGSKTALKVFAAVLAAIAALLFTWSGWPAIVALALNPAKLASPNILAPLLTVIGVVVVVLLWALPKWQVAQSKALTDENRFDRENEARKTLAQIFAGVFVLAGLYSSVQTLNLSHEGQITDRFTKAIDQLGALDQNGSPKIEVRLGGIYALERIARDSERDHRAIMDVLTAYARQRSFPADDEINTPKSDKVRGPSPDLRAVFVVLGRRQNAYDDGYFLNLERVNIRGISLQSAHLSNLNLVDVDLREADLTSSTIHDVILNGANLADAKLPFADLKNLYFLIKTDFSRADLRKVNLSGSNLSAANMSGAHLNGADLSSADLTDATAENFSKTDLGGCDLTVAAVRGADLSMTVNMTQKQIDAADGNAQTKLPPGLKTPSNWK
jgi:hypothetical protein